MTDKTITKESIVKKAITEESVIPKKQQYLSYINWFRGFAILMIVAGHTLSIKNHLQFYLFENCTVLFVFISGFLFQYLSYKFEYKYYLKKKILNVILPYIVTSIPGIIFIMNCYQANTFRDFPSYIQPILMLMTGILQNIPTWFIIMISVFYIFSFAILFLERKNILYKILPVLLLVSVFVPRVQITEYPNLSLDSMGVLINYYKQILACTINLFPVYVLGMFFSKYQEKIDMINLKYLFVLMTSVFLLDFYVGMHFKFINTTPDKILFSIFILALIKKYEPVIHTRPSLNKGLDFLAKYSFGLFFIHYYYVKLFKVFSAFISSYIPTYIVTHIPFLIYQLGEFAIVLTLSLITVYSAKKLLEKFNLKNTRMFIGI